MCDATKRQHEAGRKGEVRNGKLQWAPERDMLPDMRAKKVGDTYPKVSDKNQPLYVPDVNGKKFGDTYPKMMLRDGAGQNPRTPNPADTGNASAQKKSANPVGYMAAPKPSAALSGETGTMKDVVLTGALGASGRAKTKKKVLG